MQKIVRVMLSNIVIGIYFYLFTNVVGEMKPVEMETTEQVDTSNEEIAEHDHLVCSNGEIVSSENEGSVATKEQSDIGEAVIECLPDNEDGQMMPTSKADSVVDEENLATDDSNLCLYTENEPVALVGSMPEEENLKTDSTQQPNTHVGIETSDENLQGHDVTLVTQDDKDLTDSSEGTVNKLLENCEVSIYVTPANEEDVNEAEDHGDNLKESHIFQEDVSEDLCQNNSSAEVSLATETTDEITGEEIRDSQLNADDDTDLLGTEFAHVSGVDVPLNLEQVDAEENTEVVYKDLDEHVEAELGQYSPRFDGDQAVITHKEFFKRADEAFVSAVICESSDHKQSELDTAESSDLIGEIQADKHSFDDTLSSNVVALEKKVDGQDVKTVLEPNVEETEGIDKEECSDSIENTLSSNVGVLERRIDGQDVRTVLEPASDVKQGDAVDKEVCGDSSLDDVLVLQRVDAGQKYKHSTCIYGRHYY